MYVEVLDKTANGIKVKDSNGSQFEIRGPQLIESTMNSNQQFEKVEKVSRTAAIEALLSAGDSVFTAEYVKQDGTPRVLVGRLLSSENLLGRSNAEDLMLPASEKNRMRQIDHRTLESVIVKGTKYTVK